LPFIKLVTALGDELTLPFIKLVTGLGDELTLPFIKLVTGLGDELTLPFIKLVIELCDKCAAQSSIVRLLISGAEIIGTTSIDDLRDVLTTISVRLSSNLPALVADQTVSKVVIEWGITMKKYPQLIDVLDQQPNYTAVLRRDPSLMKWMPYFLGLEVNNEFDIALNHLEDLGVTATRLGYEIRKLIPDTSTGGMIKAIAELFKGGALNLFSKDGLKMMKELWEAVRMQGGRLEDIKKFEQYYMETLMKNQPEVAQFLAANERLNTIVAEMDVEGADSLVSIAVKMRQGFSPMDMGNFTEQQKKLLKIILAEIDGIDDITKLGEDGQGIIRRFHDTLYKTKIYIDNPFEK